MAANSLQVKRVESRKDWDVFIDVAFQINRTLPNWVPPLRLAVRDLLDVNKNPFFKHAYLGAWIAYRDNKPVGRIAAIVDEAHNRFHKEETGFFGFFESIEDQAVASGLVEAALDWIKSRGMSSVRGPVNPSTNHECGLLVDGFEKEPFIMMPYNPSYYGTLLEGCGFKKLKDLYAYELDSATMKVSDRLLAQAEKLRNNNSITFRTVKMKDFDGEIERILDVYNDAWESNWGFVPMTPEEFKHMAKDMKAILDPELLLICEVRGEAAGFALTLPDVNQAFKKIKDGKLFPIGLIKLLWYLKGPARSQTINRCRILTLGIKRQYRELGIGPMLYAEYIKRGPEKGYPVGEASWILEDNRPMNRALAFMGGQRTKVYRIYDRPLS